jgi:hypothetical protein
MRIKGGRQGGIRSGEVSDRGDQYIDATMHLAPIGDAV